MADGATPGVGTTSAPETVAPLVDGIARSVQDPEYLRFFAEFMFTIASGDLGAVKKAIDLTPKKFGNPLDFRDFAGRTPLHVAVVNKATTIIDFLLKKGARPDLRDAHGVTPLDEAYLSGQSEVVETILAHQDHDRERIASPRDPDDDSSKSGTHNLQRTQTRSSESGTQHSGGVGLEELSMIMSATNEVSIVATLLGDIVLFNNSATELFGYSQLEIVEKNVRDLCNPSDRERHDTYVRTYLETRRAKIIGTAGRQVEARHKEGHSLPVLLSVSEIQLRGQRYFVANIHDLRNIRSGRLGLDLCRAAGTGNLQALKDLLEREPNPSSPKKAAVDVNQPDYDKRTALHLAASEGHLEVVEYLLQKRAQVNALDRWGNTPMQDAIRARGAKDPTAQLLLQAGGKVLEDGRFIDMEESKFVVGDNTWEIDPQDVEIIPGRLGQGSFGVVHRGVWRGTTVAVKRLLTEKDRGVLEDFKQEIMVMRNLRHPNIVQFYGAYLRHTPYILVTEFLPGGNLEDDQHKRNKRMPTRRALKYARSIAAGMSYLHSFTPPIIHRDLKPANLLLDAYGNMKVADFGLAKFKPSFNKESAKYVMTGETGSYRYMAPEVFRHDKYTEKVDQYSFAIIFWEMLEGQMYLSYLKAVDVAQTALQGHRPTFSRKLLPGLEELIAACWDEVAEKRPTFQQICDALDAIADNKPDKCKLM